MRNLAARSESADPKLCSQIEEEGNMAALPTTAIDENSINDDKVHSNCADLSSSLNDFKRQMLEFAESVDIKIERLGIEVDKLKLKAGPLPASKDAVEELRNDVTSLLKENAEMREKILNLSLITSDLNTKVKVLENQRDNLIVALKLQQQEFEQGQITKEKSPGGDIGKWQTIGAAQQKLDKTHEDDIRTNLNLSNSFETLNDKMREENDQQNLGNGNDTDISQQPAPGHQSNTNSKAAAGLGVSSSRPWGKQQGYAV